MNCFLCQKCGKKWYSSTGDENADQKTCDCGGELKMQGVTEGVLLEEDEALAMIPVGKCRKCGKEVDTVPLHWICPYCCEFNSSREDNAEADSL